MQIKKFEGKCVAVAGAAEMVVTIEDAKRGGGGHNTARK